MTDLSALIPPLLESLHKAGARIMEDWKTQHTIIQKADSSPKTATDDAAEAIVKVGILSISDFPIVAEEAYSKGEHVTIGPDNTFWLVDALDGTREFIRGTRDFTVNAALVIEGHPVLGVIHAPAHGLSWYAIRGQGATRIVRGESKSMRVRIPQAANLTVLGGKKASDPAFLQPLIGKHTMSDRQQRGSSLKFCLVAEGRADVYSRPGETYEWDTAAGDIILREAGGVVLDIATRAPIVYGKAPDFLNTGFIAGPAALLQRPGS